jgi:hypothetical protein
MLSDPQLPWDGPFPYDALARAGITPLSPMKAVVDASYDLMFENAMTPEIRRSWDQLRLPQERLFVDFSLYRLDWPAALERAAASVASQSVAARVPVDLAAWLTITPEEVASIVAEREVPTEPVDIVPPSDLDWTPPLPSTDFIEYDR